PHGHRRGHPEGPGLVGGGEDDAAAAAADDDRGADELRPREERGRGEEGVHVDVEDRAPRVVRGALTGPGRGPELAPAHRVPISRGARRGASPRRGWPGPYVRRRRRRGPRARGAP